MKTAKYNRLFILLASIVLGAAPFSLLAESTTIKNQVHVTSNSGGNTVTGGVVTGTAKNSVSIQTIVNDEVVEDYSSESDNNISYEKVTTTANGTVKTSVQADTSDSQTSSEENSATTQISASLSEKDASTTAEAHIETKSERSFISNLLAKIFAYVSFWISLR